MHKHEVRFHNACQNVSRKKVFNLMYNSNYAFVLKCLPITYKRSIEENTSNNSLIWRKARYEMFNFIVKCSINANC